MIIKIDTKTKTECFLVQRPIWRLKLRLVEWIWPKKSHKTKNTIFDLYRGHGPISLASEAGHCSNLKIVPDLASLDQFKFFQWFSCIIFNPLSPPNTSFDLKIFYFHIVKTICNTNFLFGKSFKAKYYALKTKYWSGHRDMDTHTAYEPNIGFN